MQLLGISGVIAGFAFIVTLFSTGGFSRDTLARISLGDWEGPTPIELALIFGGIAFIATVLVLALLMLAINPADITKPRDRGVLLDPEKSDASAAISAVAAADAEAQAEAADIADAEDAGALDAADAADASGAAGSGADGGGGGGD